ncbi:hypothetical protein [Nocardia pseudobrasiliensis]|uniref:Uncharacterized protein n=1 Tax=Nocardia pseudobrasiliensis TaxID=45979 RepID=A0A370I123_9NOCA|nr:hypothetical protein [Nocardia pseudobrasiliensis]RDI64437.1 hypothetical protein DFR76_108270 [Nocardia pseudobrasiliensis]
MTGDNSPQPRPLEKLINDANSGNLTVSFSSDIRVNAEEFVYIERDCQAFKDSIRSLQRVAQNISTQKSWGLGEDQQILPSAQTVVRRFRTKAAAIDPGKDSANNVFDILEQHYQIVDDLQQLHRTIAQKYMEADQQFAAQYNELMAHVPPSPITPGPVQGPIQQADGKWR